LHPETSISRHVDSELISYTLELFRHLSPDTALLELLPQGIRAIAFLCRDDLEIFQGMAMLAGVDPDSIQQRDDLGMIIPLDGCGTV
jgi:hypothetical protein